MRGKKSLGTGMVVVLAVLMAVIPIFGACAPAEEAPPPAVPPITPPAEEKPLAPPGAEITIGFYGMLTNPGYTQVHKRMFAEIQGYCQLINEKGGIKGIPVKLVWEETAGEAPKVLTALEGFKDAGVVITTSQSTPVSNIVSAPTAEAKIPHIDSGITVAAMCPPKYNFFQCASYLDWSAGLIEWLKKNPQPPKPLNKIGFLMWDVPPGREMMKPELYDFVEALGVEVVGTEWYSPASTDYSTHITRLANDGADWIFFNGLEPMSVVCHRDMARLDLRGKIGFAGTQLTLGLPTIEAAGAENCEGSIYQTDYPCELGEGPVWNEFKNVMEEIGPGTCERVVGDPSIHMWQACMIMEGAIKMALEEEGWPITGESVYHALCSMQNFDMQGFTGPMTFSETRRIGTYAERVYVVKNGKRTALSDWFEAPAVTELPCPAGK